MVQSTTSSAHLAAGTPTFYSVTSPTPTGATSVSLTSSPLKRFQMADWAWPTSPVLSMVNQVASVHRVSLQATVSVSPFHVDDYVYMER